MLIFCSVLLINVCTKRSSVGSSPYWLNSIQHKSHSLSITNPSFSSKHQRSSPPSLSRWKWCDGGQTVTATKKIMKTKRPQALKAQTLRAFSDATAEWLRVVSDCISAAHLLFHMNRWLHSPLCVAIQELICKSLLCNFEKMIPSLKIFFSPPSQWCMDVR